MYSAKIVTVSDSASENLRVDSSGDLLEKLLKDTGYYLQSRLLTKDGIEEVSELLSKEAHLFKGVIFTTGGTGFSKRDLTPEATLKVVERLTPGIDEAIRSVSGKAKLSRGVSGIVDDCLIINFPGSVRAVEESFMKIEPLIRHGLDLIFGTDKSH